VPGLESQGSFLTQVEALRSPFPGGDHFSSRLPPRDPEPASMVARRQPPEVVLGGLEILLPGSAWPCSLGFLHSTTFMGTPLDRASPSTSPVLSPRDHVEMTASRLRGVESVPLALIRSPSLAWRAGDSLVRGWLGPYGLCQSSCLPALLVRASPFECRPSPRDESLGNAGGSTDALSHPPSFQRRWKTSPGCRDRAEGTSPAHSREGVNESWPRGAFHCLSPPWPKPRRGGGAGDCHPCLRPGHDWDTALPEVHGCLR